MILSLFLKFPNCHFTVACVLYFHLRLWDYLDLQLSVILSLTVFFSFFKFNSQFQFCSNHLNHFFPISLLLSPLVLHQKKNIYIYIDFFNNSLMPLSGIVSSGKNALYKQGKVEEILPQTLCIYITGSLYRVSQGRWGCLQCLKSLINLSRVINPIAQMTHWICKDSVNFFTDHLVLKWNTLFFTTP